MGLRLTATLADIEGAAAFGLLFGSYAALIVGTNFGSFYYAHGQGVFVFASEEFILSRSLESVREFSYLAPGITHLHPRTIGVLDEDTNDLALCDSRAPRLDLCIRKHEWEFRIDEQSDRPPEPYRNPYLSTEIAALLEFNVDAISHIRRCSKCILPATHPFIDFDQEGVCNYCRNHRKRLPVNALDQLERRIEPWRRKGGPNCLMLLSGGRDSCYALHVLKRERTAGDIGNKLVQRHG